MAVAVALSLAAPLASPGDARAAAEKTITSEPLRVMTIRVAPGEAAAVVDAIAQRARAERYAVRIEAGSDGPALAMYNYMMAVHLFATTDNAEQLELFVYDGVLSVVPIDLRRWDGVMADLCRSAPVVSCETTVSRPSPGTRDMSTYQPPLFLDMRITTGPGEADVVADAVAAYGEAHDFAVRYERGEHLDLYDDGLYVSGSILEDDFFFLTVKRGASMPTKAEVSAVVDGLREVVRGLDLDMEISEDGPDRSAEGG